MLTKCALIYSRIRELWILGRVRERVRDLTTRFSKNT